MTALHTALSLPNMAYRTATIADNLHFDVPRLINKLLGIEAIITKSRLSLRRATLVSVSKLVNPANHAHTPATAARNCFK